jgi:CheY-like chemotaxis protein
MTPNLPSSPRGVLQFLDNSRYVPGSDPDNLRDYDGVDHSAKPKVIVIDDETLIAETVVEILSHSGFQAVAVADGHAAIELAKTTKPDVVLSDVIMPGLNGVETGIRIRELVPDCRIILFSGQAATVDLLEKARQQGHHFDILAKPMKPDQLISVIRGRTN